MPGINRKLRFAPSFSNRVVRTQLYRMNRQEMADMLEWRFVQAGGRIFPFDSPTLDALFLMSKGNPRTVCGIVQVSLEYAGTTDRAITPEIIDDVSRRRLLD